MGKKVDWEAIANKLERLSAASKKGQSTTKAVRSMYYNIMVRMPNSESDLSDVSYIGEALFFYHDLVIAAI